MLTKFQNEKKEQTHRWPPPISRKTVELAGIDEKEREGSQRDQERQRKYEKLTKEEKFSSKM